MAALQPRPRQRSDPLDALVLGLVPYGAAAIEAYEACVRAVEDVQRTAARGVRFRPAKDALIRSAALTRDLGAVQASWARWMLGL